MVLQRGRVVFVGAVHEAAPALTALLESPCEISAVVTQPRNQASQPCGFVDLAPLAEQHRVPVLRTTDVNEPSTVERIRALAPDLLIVIGWSRLIRRELLSVPPRGCVGCHASLLPAHRGRAPVNWAIIRGETATGNTMILLESQADTGDIVDQRTIPIGPEDTCATLYTQVGAAGADMLRTHLPALLEGTAPRRPQRNSEADLLPKRTPEMGITDWNRPARALHDWIRGQTRPYPGAFTLIRGRQVMLWQSLPPECGDPIPTGAPPGTVLAVGPAGTTVATGAGCLTVSEISAPGQPPWPFTALGGAGIGPGVQFDPVDAPTARWTLGLAPQPVPSEVKVS